MSDLYEQYRSRTAAELGLAGNHPDAIQKHLDAYEAQAQHKVLRIVSDWCVEANEVGGVDATDLAFRLEQAGFPLPDEEG